VFESVTCRWENVKVVTKCKVFGHSPKNAPPKRGEGLRGGGRGGGRKLPREDLFFMEQKSGG